MVLILPGAKNIFRAALDQTREYVEKFSSDLLALISPLTENNDKIIHFWVHSKRLDLLEKIVDQICSEFDVSFLSKANVYGKTVLHEAVISGNLEAVKLLVGTNGELAEMKNGDGETPLLRAAAFSKTKVVRFLASHDPDRKDMHCKRKDGSSILLLPSKGCVLVSAFLFDL